MMKVYVFPGQGSQRPGMGEGLFDEFASYTEKADDILGYSIETLCLENPEGKLFRTEFTQPALYTVNVLSYLKKVKIDATRPDYVAGHSLGEYSALCVAGAFDFEVGLKLVKKRGELMSRASGGCMVAVLGCDEAAVADILRRNVLERIDIANYNSPSQIVLSGAEEDMHRAESVLEKLNVMHVPLPVSAPFHSRYMQPAMEAFGPYVEQFEYRPLDVPVISNVHARPYEDDRVAENLKQQICSPVRWTQSVGYLMAKGDVDFEEIGPGNVLTKLIGDIQASALVDAERA